MHFAAQTDLFSLRRNDDDPGPLDRQFTDYLVDLLPGADVDALGCFVEKEYVGRAE
jgi:hypothetical protein